MLGEGGHAVGTIGAAFENLLLAERAGYQKPREMETASAD